ncbi:energy-coupling factor ABC transporter ATP-binding protein [Dendrosporobacter sp. 1207_IL3150]|uniref:energy-coupling factor ABC transporter ATP-binding protein n=1 Tax=Dendrosporobacter sp. 1207_IL3150 TaxID=3084054 RepID=UPI002FD9A831
MLEFNDVSFAYHKGCPVLTNLSLIVQPGEYIAVAGRNGSGKTTLTRLIMSLLKPVKGKITFESVDTRNYSPADMASFVGYVFQNPSRQMFHDTVIEEAAFGPLQIGIPKVDAIKYAKEALVKVGLDGFETAYPASLSKGQKKRLALASVLSMKPRLLILDEPTSGQDQQDKNAFLALLDQLHSEGLAIMIITHDMSILAERAERTIVMCEGVKVYDGLALELFRTYPIEKWGLRKPVAVAVSHRLSNYGVPFAATIDKLVLELKEVGRSGING